jgi:hypothetical protein
MFFWEHIELSDLFPIGQTGGSCSGVPVFVFFLPSYFMFVLGLGLSGIRLYELRSRRRKATEEVE